MPRISSIASVTAITSGKRGRKAAQWNRAEYLIAPGTALDITDDLATACKMDEDTVVLAAADLSLLSTDQLKAWKATVALCRARAAESNDQPRTDSGGYSMVGIVLAVIGTEDEAGDTTEFVGLHMPGNEETDES